MQIGVLDGNRQLYIIGADGNGLNRLTNDPSTDFYPNWSPQQVFLTSEIPVPTAAPEDICRVSSDPTYGHTPDNPVRLGYDPRQLGATNLQCLSWLTGPGGQQLGTEVLEEINQDDAMICKVRVFYEGQENEDILYIDSYNFDQPKAPVGYTCGDPAEYIHMLANARYQQ